MISFIEVKEILDRIVGTEEPRFHGAFWRGTTRDEFVSLRVVGLPIVSVGDPAGSNLIRALRGLAPFGRDLQPRPPGARFNRMPSRRPPAEEAYIAVLEQWIKSGCPEEAGEAFVMNAREMIENVVDSARHVRFWREFDDFFLYKASAETKQHVFGFIGNSVPLWLNLALQDDDPAPWLSHISQPGVRESIDFIAYHHTRLIEAFYGPKPPQEAVFDSFWQFGGNLLPDDPDSSGPNRHTMNSPADWFNWAPYLDAVLRMDGGDANGLLVARAWHIGLVADGLLRADDKRPPNDRVRIFDFQSGDTELFAKVVERYASAPASDLLSEFGRRIRESDVFGLSVV